MWTNIPTYVTGGKAIPFYVSIDIRLRQKEWITIGTDKDKQFIGQTVFFKTHKNKTYKQQQTGEYDMYFDEGGRVPQGHIDNFKAVVVEGVAWGVITQAGAWFSYKGDNLAQGINNVVLYLEEHEDIYEQIKEELFALVEKEANRLAKDEEDED